MVVNLHKEPRKELINESSIDLIMDAPQSTAENLKTSALASYIHVDIKTQILKYFINHKIKHSYVISTAKNGVGEQFGSEQTPRGWHIIRAKIGENQPINTVFVGRRSTGEIYSPSLGLQFPYRDWILSRIFWLSGLEPGRNRLGICDTMRRYIYIHGTPDERVLGQPRSRGCIQMHNHGLVELFNMVPVGTRILIE